MLEFFLCFEEIEIIVFFFFFFELTLTFFSILECFVFNRFKGKYRYLKRRIVVLVEMKFSFQSY